MKHYIYLKNELPKLISSKKFYNYWFFYNLTKIKRILIHTIGIFSLQIMIISNLPFVNPPLPMYPPIGTAFVMFYLFGNNALLGILLGGFFGYTLNNFSAISILLYLIADLGCGYLGAYLSKNIFSIDVKFFIKLSEVIKFIIINALLTCLCSSFIRIIVFVLNNYINLKAKSLIYTYLNLWLADLNAILILYGFLLSWIYLPFSREKISNKQINLFAIIGLIAFIASCLLFINHVALFYLILIAIIAAIFGALIYGHLIGTLLLFIISSLYLTYFIKFHQYYFLYLKFPNYILISVILFLFITSIFYLGHKTLQDKD